MIRAHIATTEDLPLVPATLVTRSNRQLIAPKDSSFHTGDASVFGFGSLRIIVEDGPGINYQVRFKVADVFGTMTCDYRDAQPAQIFSAIVRDGIGAGTLTPRLRLNSASPHILMPPMPMKKIFLPGWMNCEMKGLIFLCRIKVDTELSVQFIFGTLSCIALPFTLS